jgi:hypothetical protein
VGGRGEQAIDDTKGWRKRKGRGGKGELHAMLALDPAHSPPPPPQQPQSLARSLARQLTASV